MPVGVVVRKSPGVTRWAKWSWKAVAILPGAGPADWAVLRSEGDNVEYHAATVPLELWSTDTEAYLTAISDQIPCVYVVMRPTDGTDIPYDVLLITASPYEAQDYADSAEELVEKIPMTEGLVAWVRDFANAHHVDEEFIKRRRDKKRIDQKEDGRGDARISQATDVYRAPRRKQTGAIH
ncbi:DUF3305 domain-containing protein [Parasulfitobacter algicola]|uniref:DUF3305 domain-containing protein n=1 Tax=Parasulfitobacter algicola TaxID=2614809 RepID=A0ABX2IZ32_9RHOB|nr:DUF3305 domain-containing protein [Sulfitobacter algicola]NSX55568.1 DUF3305 domain-containing protein [Sulfitobacter algicola]